MTKRLTRLFTGVCQGLWQRLWRTGYPYKPFMRKHRCIFIHIPKNAGTSVLQLFGDAGVRRHVPWIHFYRANQYAFNRSLKFSIVRHPLARLYSTYCYCVDGGNRSSDDLALQALIKFGSDNFDGFVLNVLNNDLMMQHELFMPQYLFVFDRQLHCKMDVLLNQEQLAQQWPVFASKHGFGPTLPHINQSSGGQTLPTLSAAALDKVTTTYALDYSLLGYTP